MSWTMIFSIFVIIGHTCGVVAGCHALLTKRDPRAALLWTIICLILPFGFLLYVVFGINKLSGMHRRWSSEGLQHLKTLEATFEVPAESNFEHALYQLKAFHDIKVTGDKICKGRISSGCNVQVLYDGTQAYPEMITAIENAKNSIYLSTYIFGATDIGKRFIDALVAAKNRGVEVKVLIDGVGSLYSFPTAYRHLKRQGVNVALYLSPFRSWYNLVHMNLRNHRKILVIDGAYGFTGGMNIHQENMAQGSEDAQIHDLHFRVEGPIIGFLQNVFLKAWYFSVKEPIKKVVYYDDQPKGAALCRGIASGPHHKFPQIERILIAAINSATDNIRIMTPYFIVSSPLATALTAAASRGVNVEVMMPGSNNLSFVKGACEAILPGLIQYGVKFYYRRGNFAHTKAFLIDDFCSFIGSANIDVRSLYLNFEFNLEIYDQALAKKLITHFEMAKRDALPVTLEYLQSQHFLIRFRNALLALFAPYL
jgi:cardiolipin synthase